MTTPQAKHATIRVERHYAHPVSAVFEAWRDPAARARWEPKPGGIDEDCEHVELQTGARERGRWLENGEELMCFEHHFVQVVPEQRIVTTVRMATNDSPLLSSQHVIEMTAEAGGTTLVCTEQVTWLNGQDMRPQHESGWKSLLDGLAAELESSR
jgi:uncharacterized protein YndB with AHSA1/START domain